MTLPEAIKRYAIALLMLTSHSTLANTGYLRTQQAESFLIKLPGWVRTTVQRTPPELHTLEERMQLVNILARRNFEQGTGGPFAAAIFERDSGRLVAVGVNRVIPSTCSSAHAEIVCFSLAQQTLGSYDLGAADMPAHQLVVNWRPCVMCYGATLWSGVRSLVIPGSGPEMESITGFDEGPLHPEWKFELERRGIEVIEGIGRQEALSVFADFARSHNTVYNSRQGEEE